MVVVCEIFNEFFDTGTSRRIRWVDGVNQSLCNGSYIEFYEKNISFNETGLIII